ncbi:MAG: 4Fe-4S binding protein [Planctomycetota bacterium]
MDEDTWKLECCGGPEGCRLSVGQSGALKGRLADIIRRSGWAEMRASRHSLPLRAHQKLRVSLADCPNACSQPQIRDIGIIAEKVPGTVTDACTGCGKCVSDACREGALYMDSGRAVFEPDLCVGCGLCIARCPADAIPTKGRRYRLLTGGKLGRHPRLAQQVARGLTEEEVCEATRRLLALIVERIGPSERVGDLLERIDEDVRAEVVPDEGDRAHTDE